MTTFFCARAIRVVRTEGREVRCGGWWMRIALGLAIFLTAAEMLPDGWGGVCAQEARYRVAGRVVNAVSGAVVERADVTLSDARVPTRKLEVTTGEGGEFAFTNLPAGKFVLQGVRAGYEPTAYEQHEEFSTAIVTGPGMETGDLLLRLMPLSMIAGYLLDENGEGVRFASVALYKEERSGGITEVSMIQSERSDDRGYFEFNLLKSGKYFLSVNARPWYAVHPSLLTPGKRQEAPTVPASLDVVYPLTFYGGETDEDSAEAIYLRAGDRQEVSIRLTPVPSLHLLIPTTNARGPNADAPQMPLVQRRVFGTMMLSDVELHTSERGTQEVTGLAAGRYDVLLPLGVNRGTQSMGEVNLEQNGQSLSSRGEPTGTLKVTLKARSGEALPEWCGVELLDARMKTVARGNAKGTATINELKPGWYEMEVTSREKKFSVVRIISAVGETTGNRVSVAAGTTEVTAELVEGVSEIDGIVQRDGKPIAGAMVVLAPKDEGHPELYRRDQSSLDGSFVIRDVVPGSYTIFALEDWGADWKESVGKSVVVGEKVVSVGAVEAR
jgi:hypothetical protein